MDMLEQLRDLEIKTHELKVSIDPKTSLTIYQDFNARFTKEDYLLFTIFVSSKGYFSTLA